MTSPNEAAERIKRVTSERVRLAMEVGRLRAELAEAERRLAEAGDNEYAGPEALLLAIETAAVRA